MSVPGMCSCCADAALLVHAPAQCGNTAGNGRSQALPVQHEPGMFAAAHVFVWPALCPFSIMLRLPVSHTQPCTRAGSDAMPAHPAVQVHRLS